MKRLISGIISFIIAVLLIIMIYAVVAVDEEGISGFRLFIVVTGSMSDTINPGDMVVTRRVDGSRLKENDVITFISFDKEIEGMYNTHRIIEVKDGVFYTKGDANPSADSVPVSPDDIEGKVIFHSRTAGAVLRFFSKPVNLFLFIILPLISFLISDIVKGAFVLGKAREQRENSDPENGGDIVHDICRDIGTDHNCDPSADDDGLSD